MTVDLNYTRTITHIICGFGIVIRPCGSCGLNINTIQLTFTMTTTLVTAPSPSRLDHHYETLTITTILVFPPSPQCLHYHASTTTIKLSPSQPYYISTSTKATSPSHFEFHRCSFILTTILTILPPPYYVAISIIMHMLTQTPLHSYHHISTFTQIPYDHHSYLHNHGAHHSDSLAITISLSPHSFLHHKRTVTITPGPPSQLAHYSRTPPPFPSPHTRQSATI